MDKSLVISLLGLLGWFVLKVLGLGTWTWETSISAGVLWHFTAMTTLSVVGARENWKQQGEHFLERWKNSGRKTARHALIISIGMGLWYYIIAPGALETQKRLQIEKVHQALGNPETYAELQALQPELEHRTRDEVLATQMNNLNVFYSPQFFIGLSLLLWLFVGLISAALMDLIWQRIWSR